MNQQQLFQDFLATQGGQISILGFILNLALAGLLGFLLHLLYVRFGVSVSNRRLFGRNFVPITMTTMLIITVVKSSLALSLGLVGALSIVRFRAAIKEPEELAFLFLAIAIGLGFGADQLAITLIAFAVIAGAILLRGLIQRAELHENLYVTVASNDPKNASLEKVVDTLRQHSRAANLKRFDDSGEALEATFVVEFEDFEQMNRGKIALQALGDSVNVSFVDGRGSA